MNTPVETSVMLALLPDLNAGKFLEKVDSALGAAASAAIANGKAAKVTLEFSMARIGESNQVTLTHSVEFTVPTLRGKRSEQDSTQTPLHVGATGKLTLMPDTQTRFEFDNARGNTTSDDPNPERPR